MMSVVLETGTARCVILPDIGGSVQAWQMAGRDILRRVADDANDVLAMAAFPLFPFSGRISAGKFSFQGQTYQLPHNFPPEPHAIHGQAWQAAWRVQEQTDSSCKLIYEHTGDIWPWAYRAEQDFVLREKELEVTLKLKNMDDTDMPAGMGWHPYFPVEEADIQANVTTIWKADGEGIAATSAPLTPETDVTRCRPIANLDLDYAYVGNGATLKWPTHTLEISADTIFGHQIIYTPKGEDYFCAEPVTHAPDAVNMPGEERVTGLQILAPKHSISGRIVLNVTV